MLLKSIGYKIFWRKETWRLSGGSAVYSNPFIRYDKTKIIGLAKMVFLLVFWGVHLTKHVEFLTQFKSTVNKKPAQTNDEVSFFSITKETCCYQYECEHVNKCRQNIANYTENIWECIIQAYIKTTNIDKIGLIWRAIDIDTQAFQKQGRLGLSRLGVYLQ